MIPARLVSLSVDFPRTVRPNSYWTERHPELVAGATQRSLARVFSNDGAPKSAFDRAMAPFERDPFRGAVSRRVVQEEDSVLLETRAARKAIDAAGWAVEDVDLLISTGFIPTHLGLGNAVFVAKDLGLKGAAFDLTSACGGPMNAVVAAFALVRAGVHRRIIVTSSCTYTKVGREEESLSWFLGDGAGAFAIEASTEGADLLGSASFHTADTCGTWFFELERYREQLSVAMRAHPRTGKVMRSTAEPHLRRALDEALESAGLQQRDLDFFVVHTPTAWFADFAASALGFPRERTLCTYARYTNIGPALSPVNLFHASAEGHISAGDKVALLGPGSSSSAASLIFDWGEVKLSPIPRQS